MLKVFLSTVEPSSVKQALADSHRVAAMAIEYKALMADNTWTLVPPPLHHKAIGCIKENPDGSVNKVKARLVAKGFHQTEGFDFQETFSLVIKLVTIRIILFPPITNKWDIQQIDVNNTFLNS